MATAQTFTDCNPMEKDCPNDPAMPATFETDFTAGKDAVKGWKQTAGSLNYVPGGAQFTITKKGEAGPTIQSEGFFHFGYVEVKMTAAKGQGIISSIVLESQDLDEVDWEWIGGQEGKVQMNYFGKGNTTTYDRMIEAPVAATQTETHTYALNWTAQALTWIIDGQPVRTLKYADANGGKTYPQTPCNVRIGNWAGGDSPDKGTVEWAGGVPDYSKGPFTMTVQSIKVTNYSPGTAYQWTDKSGTLQSIKVIGAGDQAGAPQNSAPIASSSSASSASGGGQPPLASGINVPVPPNQGPAANLTRPPPAAHISTAFPVLPPNSVISSLAGPPPSPTSGLRTETRPPPPPVVPSSGGGSTAPIAGRPTPSTRASASGPPPQFTGAATRSKAGALVRALAAGAMLLAL
ncbi:hypothetical protein ACEQ8H_006674 [Pleosporales sp. CAS-2024a]